MFYPAALRSLNNAGPHGLSEILYAFTSAAGNNGSAFAGLNANTGWYNYMLAVNDVRWPFRHHRAGARDRGQHGGEENLAAFAAGTFPTNGATFTVLLIGVDPYRRRAHVFPGALARPDRRALPHASRTHVLAMSA